MINGQTVSANHFTLTGYVKLQQNWEGEILSPSVSPWAQANCLIQPLLLWSSTHFNLYPKHSGTPPDTAEGWQIVELITVWQVLFKCSHSPQLSPGNGRLCADTPAEKWRDSSSAGQGSRACWVAFGFTGCHQSHDSKQHNVVQNGGCLGDVTPILNELNRAEFKQITFILCQAPLASRASEVVPFSLVLLGCSFSFPGGRKPSLSQHC